MELVYAAETSIFGDGKKSAGKIDRSQFHVTRSYHSTNDKTGKTAQNKKPTHDPR